MKNSKLMPIQTWPMAILKKPIVLKARVDALFTEAGYFLHIKNVCVNFKSYTAKIDGKTMDINVKRTRDIKISF